MDPKFTEFDMEHQQKLSTVCCEGVAVFVSRVAPLNPSQSWIVISSELDPHTSWPKCKACKGARKNYYHSFVEAV